MMPFPKRSIVMASALLTPFLVPVAAHASSADRVGLVNQQAVSEFTNSFKMTLEAHDLLKKGNTSQAKVKLDTALSKMQTALSKDNTLAIGSLQGQSLHNELKDLRSELSTQSYTEAASELSAIVGRAGASAMF